MATLQNPLKSEMEKIDPPKPAAVTPAGFVASGGAKSVMSQSATGAQVGSIDPSKPASVTPAGFVASGGAKSVMSQSATGAQVGSIDPPKPNQATATLGSVGSESTVKGQMEGLLSNGSKYLDLARTNAKATANSRGLLNSSMAAGAGERAAIEAALPIATQDASTFNNQSLTNQQAQNQTEQFNVGQSNQMLQQQWSQISSQNQEVVMKALDTESRQNLIDFEMKWNRVLEQDKNANIAYSTAMQSLGTAMSNGELSPAQQKEAAKQITDQLNAYMSFVQRVNGGDSGGSSSADAAQSNFGQAIQDQQSDRQSEINTQLESLTARQSSEIEELRKQISALQTAQRRQSSSSYAGMNNGI